MSGDRVPGQGLVRKGESFSKTVRYSREDIADFARLSHDANPLHHDLQRAQRARFGEIIASGQQTSAIMMGMMATHFSRADGELQRELLCLNVNFAFKHPVFADQDILLQWRVGSVDWNSKLNGCVAQLDGTASVARSSPSLIARCTILVKEALP